MDACLQVLISVCYFGPARQFDVRTLWSYSVNQMEPTN